MRININRQYIVYIISSNILILFNIYFNRFVYYILLFCCQFKQKLVEEY